MLRSPVDQKGNKKTEEQLRRDTERVNRIIDISKNFDPFTLGLMAADANDRQPNVELEDVIAT